MRERLQLRSADGTRLSADRRGSGPPLVLVHGIAGDASRWIVSRRLGEHFTLYALDRRGRGASDDGGAYALAREVEDVAALVDSIGGEVFLLGHSFGGLLALEATARTEVAKLLVYEPYAPPAPAPEPSAVTRSFAAMIADPEALLVRFLRDIVQMSDADVARLRASTAWPARVAAARTIPREMAAVEQHRTTFEPLAERATPVRFLLGERSPPFLREATERFHAQLPGSDVVELPNQAHVAMDAAPDLFEREVRAFFLGG
ncbi:MAG: alpha/beta hydrolase [Labilithrix sp.]|nr:alpha/beta hydrolase [Labilithrix sp.]MCW5835069.1 alpha/beta hydrolase [Labilithrix sp.]